MTTPTEADIRKAEKIVEALFTEKYKLPKDIVAQALAEQREADAVIAEELDLGKLSYIPYAVSRIAEAIRGQK